MNINIILKIIGALLMLFSITMLIPAGVGWFYQDAAEHLFLVTAFGTLTTGLLLWYPRRYYRREIKTRDGFIVVVLLWAVLGSFGAIPFLLMDNPLSVTDALFESISALTTTGATVITGLDYLPKSLLYYRQQLQWLGGMGIIVLAVAVLPMLGVGGMQLYRAETPGPVKDSKLTPRIAGTAKALWGIYLGLTILCALAYYFAGMSVFDAIGHSFSTIAIGGFSTYDASIGHFNSHIIEMVCVVFLIISGINFSLHFAVLRRRSMKVYFKDPELKFYLLLMAVVTLLSTILLFAKTETSISEAFYDSLFQAVSMGTTAGFATENFSDWPKFLPVMLIFASFVGGCAGSTGGGLKVIRFLLLFKQGLREVRRVIHPNALFIIKLGQSPVENRVIDAVWGFLAAYVALFVVFMTIMMACGLDQITAFSAVAACLNNLGPGLGDVAAHYGNISDTAKSVLCLAMLMGRLEIFTILVLFMPSFWRN
jgi:trk system potassium uptake protein TrkH